MSRYGGGCADNLLQLNGLNEEVTVNSTERGNKKSSAPAADASTNGAAKGYNLTAVNSFQDYTKNNFKEVE